MRSLKAARGGGSKEAEGTAACGPARCVDVMQTGTQGIGAMTAAVK